MPRRQGESAGKTRRKKSRVPRAAGHVAPRWTDVMRLLEDAHDIIFRYRLTPSRGFEYVSSAVTRITGYTPEEVYTVPGLHLKVVHPEDLPLLDVVRRSPAHNEPITLRLVRKDGTVAWVEWRNVPAFDKAGNLVAVEGVARDITGRKRSEDTANCVASRLARILSNLSDIAYEVATAGDPLAGQVLFVSRSVEGVLGLRPEELVQDSSLWFQLMHPDDAPSVAAATRTMYERRQPCTRSYRLRQRSTGEYRAIEDRVVPRLDDAGRVVGYFGTARDVTDRIVAEDLLRFQAEILRNVRDSVIVTDVEGRITYWNEGATAIFGYRAEEMLGGTPTLLYPDQDLAALEVDLARILEGVDYVGEWLGRRKDGSPAWVNIKTTVLRGSDGRLAGFIGISEDITERKRRAAQLRESEERFRGLFETSKDAVYVSARSGQLLDVNEAAVELWGGSREELLRLNATDLYADPADRAHFVAEIESQGGVRDLEVRLRRQDGSVRDCVLAASVRRAADGAVLGYQGIIHDITQRKQAEDAVRESRDRLRALAAELHTVREEERTLIAQEIHDEFGQVLTGLKMDLVWLRDHCRADHDAQRERLDAMLVLVDGSVEAVRRVATRLRPAVLDDLGLAAAIEWLAADFAAHAGIECRCDVPAVEPKLSPERSTAVFRIAQEALTNVARHAGATRVSVRCTIAENGVRLEVRDDGRGITPDEVSGVRSIGLIGMRERAKALGGHVFVQPGAERGTVVTVQMPFAPPAAPSTR